jgi:antitoxin HicB
MKMAFPAIIVWNDKDQIFEVSFPDFPGCITFGATREEAELMASDVLSGILESMIKRSIDIPIASKAKGATLIAPAPSVAFALWLRARRNASGMTLTDVADKLGVKYQVYQKLENPETANPTLRTIAKLERVFGVTLVAL